MRVPLLPAAIGLILLAGCATEPLQPGAQPDETNISVTAFTLGTTISTIVVEVTGPDIGSPLIFNLSVDEATDVASGTVRVPHGDARIFALTAFDDAGEITHEGQAEIDVRPGQNPPLRINLGPRSGHVPVTVSFGSYSVIVVPSSASLDLGGASTAQLSVEVLDENGEVVSDLSNVQWATDAPAVATVDASGLVTGVTGGSATIVATYEGVAGMSAITVTGAGTGLPDADEDGWTADVDCDDTDSTIHPGAAEVVDGRDNDCDGVVDGGASAVVFVSQMPGQSSSALWAVEASGSTATDHTVVATGPFEQPDYSRDGSRLAVVIEGNIHILNPDGSGLTQLTFLGADMDPDWSPGGTRIAFSRHAGLGTREILVMNADGSGLTTLTSNGDANPNRQPDWAPDGYTILYSSGFILNLINADGTDPRRVAPFSLPAQQSDPAWSPDGTRIAFRLGCSVQSDENERCSFSSTGYVPEIWLMNADGTNPLNLTNNAVADLEPAWSPDGNAILFRRFSPEWDGGTLGDLYIMGTNGAGAVEFADSGFHDGHPTWSPATMP